MTEHGDGRRAPEPVKVTDRRRFAGGAGASDADAPAPADVGAEGIGGGAADVGDVGVAADGPALEEARREARSHLEHLQRLQADFDNFRKRAEREQARAVDLAARPVMERMLEVLDDFEMAFSALPDDGSTPEGFRRGMELLYAKLVDALRSEGLERIDSLGEAFDPTVHEALMQTGDGDAEPVVAEVFRQGYRLNGIVLRPASVRVERP